MRSIATTDEVFAAKSTAVCTSSTASLARTAGAQAADVRQLAKPSIAAWAVNQIYWKRRDVYDAHPWIAPNLVAAFEEAKRRSFRRLADVSASWLPIPWSFDYLPQAQALLGDDPWPYGVAPNRATLSAFLTLAFEQGVCARRLEPEELFPPSVQRTYRM